jgi:hypothetical protein
MVTSSLYFKERSPSVCTYVLQGKELQGKKFRLSTFSKARGGVGYTWRVMSSAALNSLGERSACLSVCMYFF